MNKENGKKTTYKKIRTYISDVLVKEDNEKLSFITHYMHTLGTDDEKKYKAAAKKYMPKEFFQMKFSWSDIPFPDTKNPKFTFIDLFAGIGGMRLAFQSLGGKSVFSSEW